MRRPSRSLPASSLALTRPLASSPRIRSRSAGAAVLVFSTTDRASFDAIRRWRDKVEEQCGPIAMCICQNKVDLIDDAAVDPGEPEALAREMTYLIPSSTSRSERARFYEIFITPMCMSSSRAAPSCPSSRRRGVAILSTGPPLPLAVP